MSDTVTYVLHDGVATVTLDDGKVNALSLAVLDQLRAGFDRAEGDGAVVVLTGRPGVFSAGFDLTVLRGGGPDAVPMLRAGFALAERMLSFPFPVLVACSGHAVAMACFLLLSGDYRLGVDGPFRITANEVAIGLTMPRAAVELCRQRLAPAQFTRAVMLSEVFSPGEAIAAGFLDGVAAPEAFDDVVAGAARDLAALDMAAHRATKARARRAVLADLRAAIEEDDAEFDGNPSSTS